jgi:ribonuclease R
VARVDLETRKIDLRLVTDAELAGEEAPAKQSGGKRKGEKKSMVKPGPATEQRHEIKASGGKGGGRSGGAKPAAKAQAKAAPKEAPKAAAPKRSKKPAAAPAAAAPRAAKTVSKTSKNKR